MHLLLDAFSEVEHPADMTTDPDTRHDEMSIEVLCLGNPDRGDDAAGLHVPGLLAGRLPADVALHTSTGDLLAHIHRWHQLDTLVCVDAAGSLGTPGRIHRIDYSTADRLPSLSVTSTHHFSLDETLRLADALNRAPKCVVLLAIETETYGFGAPMAPVVAAALPALADAVVTEVVRARWGKSRRNSDAIGSPQPANLLRGPEP